jgi:CheY-like chemotaxis protein
MTVSPQQVLAARTGLGLSREEFAKKAQVSPHTIMKFEQEAVKAHPSTKMMLKAALEAEGAVFLPDGGVLLPGNVLAELARRTLEGVAAARRVLIVEDELLLFDEMRDELLAEGAEVMGPAPSVSKALALLAAEPRPDAAILDINLAGEMVYPVAEALRERRIPFIFVTGYDERIVPRGYNWVPLLEKPVSMHRVLQTLHAL